MNGDKNQAMSGGTMPEMESTEPASAMPSAGESKSWMSNPVVWAVVAVVVLALVWLLFLR